MCYSLFQQERIEDYGRRSKYIRRITKQSIKRRKVKTTAPRNQNRSRPAICLLQDLPESWLELYEMELIAAGEAFHAAMKRSTNGGGENSPMIEAEDDFYELFFANLEDH